MPPKRGASGKKKATKDDSEEFQSMLSELNKITKVHGSELKKVREKEDIVKKQNAERHTAIAKKASTSDLEAYLERQAQQRQLQQLFQQMMMANRPFLSSPKTDFTGDTASLPGKLEIAVGSMQGWRSNMEDAHVIDLAIGNDSGLFAVLDGHAGDQCAKQGKILIPALVRKHTNPQTNKVDFTTAIMELDSVLRGKLKDDSGSTACIVMTTPTSVICANVGDSRAVLCRGTAAIELSEDHKPDSEDEKKRIEAAGGHVENNRVNGQLAMSRAIGDYSYKQQDDRAVDEQLVVPVPDIVVKERHPEDKFVVLGCDGIFDVLSNQEVVDFVNQELTKDPNQPLVKICEALCNTCLAPVGPGGQPSRAVGTDNMTVLIVKLL